MSSTKDSEHSIAPVNGCITRSYCPSCGSSMVKFQRTMAHSDILECRACGAGFSAQVPAEAEICALYDRLYAPGSAYQGHRDAVARMQSIAEKGTRLRVGWEQRFFFANIIPKSGDRLLDIGCGTGLFVMAAAQRGWESSGVDASDEAARLGAVIHRRPVYVGRVENTELEAGGFAAVTAWEVTEHLPEPLKFLRKVLEILRPKGVFAGSVPNYGRPRYRYGSDLGPSSVPPVHLNFWTPASLEALLKTAGFSEVETYSPRFAWDVLRPLRSFRLARAIRFAKIVLSRDVPTTVAFIAKGP